MVKQLQLRRLFAMTVLLALAFAGLGYRLVDLQVLRHGELAKEARSNTQYTYHLEPRRGDILDAHSNLLATSYFVKTVCGDPSWSSNYQTLIAQTIAPILQIKADELEKKLTPRVVVKNGRTNAVNYVRLKARVSYEDWDRLTNAMEHISFGVDEKKLRPKEKYFYDTVRHKAIFTDPVDEQVRNYPMASLAAHVLGFVGGVQITNNGTISDTTIGMDGIERSFDAKLRGVRGYRVSERDHQQREMVSLREEDVEAHDGLNVVLTLDSVVQHILETELAVGMKANQPDSISGIVIRPATGEILAMASFPNFDPNHPGATPVDALQNRVISAPAEPGSTFKIVVVSGALNDHVVKLSNQFDCEHGRFVFGGKILHDHETKWGVLTVEEIITHSSNIGAAKIGILMQEPKLYDYIRGFGFGTLTGIPLPSESRGIVHPLANWNKFSISRIPMGQEISATSLQMTMAMCAVANRGVLMQPMLVDRLQERDGSIAVQYHPQTVRRVISEEAAREMVTALKTVVTTNGTAVGAAMTNYTVAGKTGTAQKADKTGYSNKKFFASFIGFFPADNPEICIYVGMDTPKTADHFGGTTAGPVFKRIATQAANYLNIHPDRGDPSGMLELPMAATDSPLKTAARMP